jgi:hypothetical protein
MELSVAVCSYFHLILFYIRNYTISVKGKATPIKNFHEGHSLVLQLFFLDKPAPFSYSQINPRQVFIYSFRETSEKESFPEGRKAGEEDVTCQWNIRMNMS